MARSDAARARGCICGRTPQHQPEEASRGAEQAQLPPAAAAAAGATAAGGGGKANAEQTPPMPRATHTVAQTARGEPAHLLQPDVARRPAAGQETIEHRLDLTAVLDEVHHPLLNLGHPTRRLVAARGRLRRGGALVMRDVSASHTVGASCLSRHTQGRREERAGEGAERRGRARAQSGPNWPRRRDEEEKNRTYAGMGAGGVRAGGGREAPASNTWVAWSWRS